MSILLRRRAGGLVATLLVVSLPAAALATAAWAVDPEVNTNESAPYLRSTDGGDDFSPQNLDTVGEGVGGITDVDATDGVVHAIFSTNTDPKEDFPWKVIYRRSTDGGRNFGDPVRVDDDTAISSEASLDAEGGVVHVAYEDQVPEADFGEAFYARSTDGESFERENLSDTAAADEKDPHVAALGERVAVVYESDDDDDDVADTTDNTDVVIRISDDGDDFDAGINLTAGTPADGLRQDQPEVGLNDDVVVVVFRVRDPEARIGYVRSDQGGADGTWSGVAFLPGDVDTEDFPGLYMDGDDVHVAACHEADPAVPGDTNRLLYWHSGDAGASFEGPVVIATFAEKCAKPAIDGNGDDLHIAVEGDVAGKGDVFGTHSANGGGTWSAPENLSANPESSGDPAVAVDDDDEDDVHVTWSDQSAFLFSVKYGDSLDLTDGDDRHFANEDVIRYLGNSYETILDGSDVGLRNLRIDAMAELAPTENGDPTRYVLSFTEKAPIPGIDERVDDSDLVLFTPTSLGVDTDGTFELYFEGSGIGLTRSGEDVDAVEIDGADLYLSTYGSFELSDDYGELSGKNEDVFVCRDFALDGCGEAEVVFDGSERELADSGENVDAFGFNEDGNEPKGIGFFSTNGDFETATAQGEDDDLFSCRFPELEFEDDEETVPVPGTRDGDLGTCNDGEADSAFHSTFDADVNRLHEDVMSVEIQF